MLHETTTSYTSATIIPDEKKGTIRDHLARLCVRLRPPSGPLVRVDPASGFASLKDNGILQQLGILIEIGRIKKHEQEPHS